jgi:hypothetical protein
MNAVKDPANLGNVLKKLRLVDVETLKKAVSQQIDGHGEAHLGEILVKMGACTEEDVAVSLEIQKALRAGDELKATLLMARHQNARIGRSVSRSVANVDSALELPALKVAG